MLVSISEAGQRDLLLDEMSHRLANLLHLISGLVRMRMADVPDGRGREHLTWILDVIAVFALLQHHLTSPSTSSFQDYLKETASLWDQIWGPRGISIQAQVDCEIDIPEQTASCLALITHELVTNSIEHGFPAGRAGGVTIGLRRGRGGVQAELWIEDDGIGFDRPAEVGRLQMKSIGLGLVGKLADRIGGSFEVGPGRETGLLACVRFPLRPAAADKPVRAMPAQ